MNRRLVFFDVDGTILAGRRLPDSAVSAIRKVRENGHLAVFFTGRPYSHMDPRLLAIGFDGCICTMGAYVRVGDEVLRDIKPDPADTQNIIRLVREAKLDAAYESMEGICFDHTRPLPEFLKGLKKHFTEMGFDTDRNIDDACFTFDKLCVWTNEHSRAAEFEEKISAYLKCIGKKQNMSEWTSKAVSTEDSMHLVMSRLGIAKEATYGIGDSPTDLPMLSCTGYTMAMGQAPDSLKNNTDYITDPLEQDGLAHAMMHCGLI